MIKSFKVMRCRLGGVRFAAVLVVSLASGLAVPVQADVGHLPEIQVLGPQDAQIGSADSASEGAAVRDSFQSRPKLRPGDIIEAVPGVVATQHSGDGKANQYFLRGFNLDHGTDFSIQLDGMPVNMPSHGHGQGYADLNFLIPELVSGVRYRKGPYSVEAGDFALAGSASLDYFSAIVPAFAQVSFGPNNYRRSLLAGSHSRDNQTWLAALEVQGDDGPWVQPQGMRKVNAVLRYSQGNTTQGWHITGMAYDNRWNATDQIPERALASGALSRFASLDPTDGGDTRRLSLSGQWFNQGPRGKTQISAYAIDYRLNLWSNFTYFLDNPVQGDQFEQADQRRIYGAQISHSTSHSVAGYDGVLSLGSSWRGDRIGSIGLYATQARERLATVRDDSVALDLFSAYGQQLLMLSPRWRVYAGLRGDMLNYRVTGQEPVYGPANSGQGRDALLSPKAGVAWTLTPTYELYANAGEGFHSNDARGATLSTDPKTGLPADRVAAMVKGRGTELGVRYMPGPGLTATLAAWQLRLDSELVYVGDAGATEPGRASLRNGLEASLRWSPAPAWRFELDAAVSRARFEGEPAAGEGNVIPNAAEQVLAAGVTWLNGPWRSTLRVRHMGARALDSLGAERASPNTLLNLGFRYAAGKSLTLGLDVFNLLDTTANDIEYQYASCTAGEVSAGTCGGGINGRHVHPMVPRTLRLTARLGF